MRLYYTIKDSITLTITSFLFFFFLIHINFFFKPSHLINWLKFSRYNYIIVKKIVVCHLDTYAIKLRYSSQDALLVKIVKSTQVIGIIRIVEVNYKFAMMRFIYFVLDVQSIKLYLNGDFLVALMAIKNLHFKELFQL